MHRAYGDVLTSGQWELLLLLLEQLGDSFFLSKVGDISSLFSLFSIYVYVEGCHNGCHNASECNDIMFGDHVLLLPVLEVQRHHQNSQVGVLRLC